MEFSTIRAINSHIHKRPNGKRVYLRQGEGTTETFALVAKARTVKGWLQVRLFGNEEWIEAPSWRSLSSRTSNEKA